jgi:hypothetical protein
LPVAQQLMVYPSAGKWSVIAAVDGKPGRPMGWQAGGTLFSRKTEAKMVFSSTAE